MDMESCLFVREDYKIHQSGKTPRVPFNGQPLLMELEVILIMVFPTWREMAVKQVAKAVGILKEVRTYITSHVCNSFARRWYGYYHAQRPLIHQNIETTMDYCKLPNYRANKI
jgi:hypothetical protein